MASVEQASLLDISMKTPTHQTGASATKFSSVQDIRTSNERQDAPSMIPLLSTMLLAGGLLRFEGGIGHQGMPNHMAGPGWIALKDRTGQLTTLYDYAWYLF